MSQKKNRLQKNPSTPLQPTTARVQESVKAETSSNANRMAQRQTDNLLFGRENYKWMLIGFGVMILGFILMSGGAMPDPNTWDPNLIYSFRRITVAPILILLGIGIEIYAIFKPKSQAQKVA